VKRNRLVDGIIAAAAVGCLVLAVRDFRLGVPIHDVWLFPMLVGLPVLGAVAFGLSLLARPGLRLNLLVLTVSSIATLYLVEGAMQAMQPAFPPSREQAALDAGRKWDVRDKAEVALTLRESGVDGAGIVLPATSLRNRAGRNGVGVTIDGQPIAVLSNLSGRILVNCNESGEYTLYESDEHGFNNPPGTWSGPIDVAIVGDSFAVGACVDPADNVPARLRARGVRSAGAATVGFGPISELGLLKEYVAPARPRDIFWFYYEWNDLHEMHGELAVPQLTRYLEPRYTQKLLELQPVIDSQLAAFTDAQLAAHTPRPARTAAPGGGRGIRAVAAEWLKLYRLRHALGLSGIRERVTQCCDLETFEGVLAEADRTVVAWGGRLHLVYLPAALRYYRPASAVVNDAMRQKRRILRIARDLGLSVVDMDSVFRRQPDPRSMFYDYRSHFSVEGYRVTAEALGEYLKALGYDLR